MKKIKPKIALADLLRRRQVPLAQFLQENGISTYESLKIRCDQIGVAEPTRDQFESARGSKVVSSPSEGVAVFVPPVADVSPDQEFPVAEKAPKKPRKKKADGVEQAEGSEGESEASE